MTCILGISAYFHDSSACLIKSGNIVWASEEERFSRIKHDASFPWRSIMHGLRHTGTSLADVDCVAYYESPDQKLGRQLAMATHQEAKPVVRRHAARSLTTRSQIEWEIREMLGFDGPVRFFDHHGSHAAAAFFCSDFDEASILTVDGVGEWCTTAMGRGTDEGIELFARVDFPHSLGLLYSTITSYLGFDVNDSEYKVMGLAPYGAPKYVDSIRKMIRLTEDTLYDLNMEFFDFHRANRMYSDRTVELLGQAPRVPGTEVTQFHKDIAKSIQVVLEEVMLDLTQKLYAKAPSENLCMAGGVALNCVANGRILREGPFKRLYVQPAASDAGSCIGAAGLAYHELTGERPCRDMRHVYLGQSGSKVKTRALLRESGSSIPRIRIRVRPAARGCSVAGARKGRRLVSRQN